MPSVTLPDYEPVRVCEVRDLGPAVPTEVLRQRFTYTIFSTEGMGPVSSDLPYEASEFDDPLEWMEYMERVGALLADEDRMARHEAAANRAARVFWEVVGE